MHEPGSDQNGQPQPPLDLRSVTPVRPSLRGLLIMILFSALGLALWGGSPARADGGPERVSLVRTPDGGIQPQAAVDARGAIHLVYFKGDPAAGDVFYVHAEPGAERFSKPIRVNSQSGSAVALGTVRGAQLALGKAGRVHVAWNGSSRALPRNSPREAPMLYTRSTDDRTGFEPQRNLMQITFGLDGGGTVAADPSGNVYVAWHGRTAGDPTGEAGRRIWLVRSSDQGATFSREEPAVAPPTGACACCAARALADRRGTLFIVYRTATGNVHRDMDLLISRDQGEHFQARRIDRWKLSVCPMSTESFAEAEAGVLAAWETKGQVSTARIDPVRLKMSPPVAPPGPGRRRKHPAVAGDAEGRTILVWTEDTGWQKGGSLAWQVFDRSGRPSGESGRIEGAVPVWGLATVVARPGRGFTIIY